MPEATTHATTKPRDDHDTTFVETLQSLIVAFVLAMTFRGFVTEGFVIPTGSMAPTLLGQHYMLHSDQTGITFPVGHPAPNDGRPRYLDAVPDPVLGPNYLGSGTTRSHQRRRMGDRILVLKSLYPFRELDRFDVVVFKNPTDPDGPSANYIKRLIGLPNEAIWLADGDVFVAPHGSDGVTDAFRIQRKPEHVQRAVWQLVHDSRLVPQSPDSLSSRLSGPPWSGSGWDTAGRSYRCDSAEPTTLEWNTSARPLDDWTVYDVLNNQRDVPRKTRPWIPSTNYTVSDIRVSAAVRADDPAALSMRFQLETRSHLFEFIVAEEAGRVRMRPVDEPDGWTSSEPQPLPARGLLPVEFWHVDQTLLLFVDGEEVARLEYDWDAEQRMTHTVGRFDGGGLDPDQPVISWRFEGSPVTLERVRTDRDLYYRPDPLRTSQNPEPPGLDPDRRVVPGGHGFGTHQTSVARLGPDHYFMCGDNNQASQDSRLWGYPHPFVAHQVDTSPFVVNRKLIIGKAWVVYFPAPYSITEDGIPFVPDFGRLRFIR